MIFKISTTIILLAAATNCVVFVGCSTTGTVNLPAPGGGSQLTGQVRGQNLGDEEEKDGLLGSWAPEKIYSRAKAAAGFGPNRQVAETLLNEGRELFKEATNLKGTESKQKYLAAAEKFEKAANRWPNSAIEEDALFLLAESNFFADHYPKATLAYNAVTKKHENTQYMDTIGSRRFAIADYWIKHHEADPDFLLTPNFTDEDRPRFNKFGQGVRALDKIRLEDPTGKLADDATMRSAIANYDDERFVRADELFEDLRRSFPSSEHQFLAHLYGVRCKLKIYQGPSYSLKPMDDAEQLIRQIRTQFPQESRSEDEFLTNAWKEVRKNKALHDWAVAKYYDRRKEYGAAAQYYERIANEYDDTSLAQEARDRIAVISDKPMKPTQKLPWLAKMFPTPEREKPLVASNPLQKIRR